MKGVLDSNQMEMAHLVRAALKQAAEDEKADDLTRQAANQALTALPSEWLAISRETLRHRLQSNPNGISTARATELILQLLDAVNYVHQHSVIHRDIKPNNILLVSCNDLDQERVVLVDSGFPQMMGESKLLASGNFVGTPEYMSPELFSGSASFQSDIYSVGVVLYELITGKSPFQGPPLAIMQAKLAGDPISPLPASTPPNIRRAVETALQSDPAMRFSSVREFQLTLEADKTQPAPAKEEIEEYGSPDPRRRFAGWSTILRGFASLFDFSNSLHKCAGQPASQSAAMRDVADAWAEVGGALNGLIPQK